MVEPFTRFHNTKCQRNQLLLLFSAIKFGNQLEARDAKSLGYMKGYGYLTGRR